MSDSEPETRNPDPSSLALVTVSADQFAQMMSSISESHSRIDAKLAEFQEEIFQGQEDAAAKALKGHGSTNPMYSRSGATKSRPASMPRSTRPLLKWRAAWPQLWLALHCPPQFSG